MPKRDYFFVIYSFLIWRVGILIIALFAIKLIPLFSHNYLGGGFSNYQKNPLFWGHLNFDGEHYLSIAQDGYKSLEYFFFPLFPYLVRTVNSSGSQISLSLIGLIISNISFIFFLLGIYKLVRLDYKEYIAKLTVILFLFFPTSFYFSVYYTESFFLMLVVWSFYFTKKGNFWLSSVFASFASATRVIGIILSPIILLELLIQKNKFQISKIIYICAIAPLGFISYIYFLWKNTNDPLIFLHQVSIFGDQRSSRLILLPQVFYRYIFKILPSINYHYFPIIFTTYLEFIVSILFLCLILYGFSKLRISYSLFSLFAFLIPTLAGSFSSMPRYVLAIFPVFILLSLTLSKKPKMYLYLVLSVMLILMVISTSLFWRGYWLS